ncbi:Uncharacterised protein [Chlamydia trachomatis]|nr:Uncharacterised protein [Chlamydia trachomatis]
MLKYNYMKMNDFVTKTNLNEVMHSSGYAKAQSGSNFGSADSRNSFSQRQKIDYSQSIVKSYSDSQLGRLDSNRRAARTGANSTLTKIRERRQQLEETQGMNRQKNMALKDSDIDSSTKRRMGTYSSNNDSSSRNSSRDFNSISQSGIARGSSFQSSSTPSGNNFYNFRPPLK